MRESVEPNIIFKPNKKHKFGAIKTTIDGYTFDSKSEAAYYSQLKLLKYGKQIKDFECQPEFEIFPSYIHPASGKKVSAIKYKADFKVYLNDGSVEIVDVKSKPTITEVYKIKKKLFEARYHIAIVEIIDGVRKGEPKRKVTPRTRTSRAKATVDKRKL